MLSVVETDFFSYRQEAGIVYLRYKFIDFLDLSIAKAIVSSRLQLQDGEVYCIFCDTRGIKDSNKAGRDYLAREGSALAEVIVLFDDREMGGFMVDFYLSRNNPLVPTFSFTDETEALVFLRDGIWKKQLD